MNRSIFIPGLCLAFVVAGVYRGEVSKVDAAAQEQVAAKPEVAKRTGRTPSKPIDLTQQSEFEALEDELLDGWPVLTKTSRMSRAGPRQSLYAYVKLESRKQSAAEHFLLGNLVVVVKRKSHTFPLMVDHVTGRTHVFANNRWQDYGTWKPDAINECLVAAGMKLPSEKSLVARSVARVGPASSRNTAKTAGRGDSYDDAYGNDFAVPEKRTSLAVGEMPNAK